MGAYRQFPLAFFGLLLIAVAAPLASILVLPAMGALPLVGAVVCLAGSLWATRRPPPVDRTLAAGLAVLLAWAATSALWAADPGFAAGRVLRLAYLTAGGLVLLAAAQTLEAGHKRLLLAVFVAAVAVGIALLLEELLLNYPLYRAVRGIPSRPRVLPSVLNRGAMVLAVLVWPAMLAARRFVPAWVAALLPVTLFGVLLGTQSQSAALGMATAGGVYLLAARAPAVARRGLTAVLVVGVLAAPWLALGLHDAQPSFLTDWRTASAGARMEIWDASARMALEKPLFGWGMEAIRSTPDLFQEPVVFMRNRDTTMHPHNGPLQVWVDLGLVGVVLTLGILVQIVRRIGRLSGPAHATALALLAIVCTVSTVSHGLWQSWWIGLISTAAAFLAMAADDPARRRQAEGEGALKTEMHGPWPASW
ncbi:O-antigen ligase family protein [Azospirillum sp.]|uniref:O-antigen ligase family protein n=1 Tax=Azospirillum sp. TaxID=34012 RepID=UPI002D6B95FC|nr:O-antigen ligase family protein [Azospirillum sp.]HYD64554.1 O-antigen ligase family protein [Azospirillum sp.]